MPEPDLPFHSPFAHGFFRAAVAVPEVAVADPTRNLEQTLKLARQASEQSAGLVIFPELGLSSYALDDLLFQDALLDAVEEALAELAVATQDLLPAVVVGAPLRTEGRLFNCAVALYRGRFLGIVPKTYLPGYREFYEKRHFTSGHLAGRQQLRLAGHEVPFGTDLLFEAPEVPGLCLHLEVCEDLWAPIPPSTYGALAGATVLANLSASNVTVGKSAYRRLLVASQSGRAVAAYLYTGAGAGESTTDLAWDGDAFIYENGELLGESQRFAREPQLVTVDLDLDRLRQERARLTTFQDCTAAHGQQVRSFRRISFPFEAPRSSTALRREVPRFPYVPADPTHLDERCAEVYQIQVQGLAQRLQATGIEKVVLGVSGGLDSTQALIVAARTFDRLKRPREGILAYTLPGFATSRRTYRNAWALMEALGVSCQEIDIRPSAEQMLRDLDHPYARGEKVYDVTFENVQAGERTSHLFRLANQRGALVLGTGDLSELALGWNTYGVGDQMSHYNVNASVPKTLIQHLIAWEAGHAQLGDGVAEILRSILGTEISPELVPDEDGQGESPAQSSEAVIGPYELQDFHLYYLSRYGFRPSKVAYLALTAWGDRERGSWPVTVAQSERRQYRLDEIKKWLEVFLRRFFELSQYKRSAMPNGPKVGSGGSLSPRGDWRAPSDASARAWLEELRRNLP